jgi:hypothetical protein
MAHGKPRHTLNSLVFEFSFSISKWDSLGTNTTAALGFLLFSLGVITLAGVIEPVAESGALRGISRLLSARVTEGTVKLG